MNPITKLVDYLRSAKAEALKVSWPSKEDTIRYSSLVIGVSVGLALAFAAVDFGFTKLFQVTLLEQVARNKAAEQAAATSTPTAPVTPETPTLDIDSVDSGKDVNITPLDIAPTQTDTKK